MKVPMREALAEFNKAEREHKNEEGGLEWG